MKWLLFNCTTKISVLFIFSRLSEVKCEISLCLFTGYTGIFTFADFCYLKQKFSILLIPSICRVSQIQSQGNFLILLYWIEPLSLFTSCIKNIQFCRFLLF